MDRFFEVQSLEKVLGFAGDFPVKDTENVPLDRAAFRVLAEDIVSAENVPGFRRATMDGYAVFSSTTFGASESSPAWLEIKGTIRMGEIPDFELSPGTAAEISTGGMLPKGADSEPRMHEFIITLRDEDYAQLESVGLRKADSAMRIGKLFLDFGFHAPTVAWPEPLGLMIEPTESYTKAELDRFADAVVAIRRLITEHPEALLSAPHFTPIDRVEEVEANRDVCLSESLDELPAINLPRISTKELAKMPVDAIYQKIVEASKSAA